MSVTRKLTAFAMLPIAAASLSLGAGSAVAAPVAANTTAASCELTGGTLTWGVKESFRSYISGGIAHGSWEALDGATYETPNFNFTNGAGSAAATTGAEVKFGGKLLFTGHNGLLDLTMSNPTLVIKDNQSATLKLDMRSNDTSGELAVDESQVTVADINLAGNVTYDANTITITAAPAVLAEAGVAAFGDFYEAGAELDPVTFSVTSAAGCAGAAFGEEVAAPQTTAESAETAQAEPEAVAVKQEPAATGSQVPVLPIALTAGGLLVVGGTVWAVMARRKREQRNDTEL
ncbi:HtaA domain-containing protein [Canibacter oris]|uniref:Htaa domain-containing protein n=1 Tax=Canibacter oris TaxID=1365628 RepID=A0A840DEC2_9MICO|nr:HtaA domain-containing protein [Canibacter oris]MBB4071791.1 hypothetical protein [Canibacter oris]